MNMSNSAKHASFTIERHLPAPPALVFNAFSNPTAKAQWFAGPSEWKTEPHQLDFRVGGRETVAGGPQEGPVHKFIGVYEDIVPNERIVYTYNMYMDDVRISVSLATFEFINQDDGTLLKFTEQVVFLDGLDSIESRRAGTEELLNNLEKILSDKMFEENSNAHDNNVQNYSDTSGREIISQRIFYSNPEKLFTAWSNPKHLANWWGPKDFKNTFEIYEFKPNGIWRFLMHGPDGTDYPNESRFIKIVPNQKIVMEHLSGHHFELTATFEPVEEKTLFVFRMLFDSNDECEKVKNFIVEANEQNLDRLEAELLNII